MRDQPTGGSGTATALVAGGARRISAPQTAITPAKTRRIQTRRPPTTIAHATYHTATTVNDGPGTSTTSHGARSTSDADRISAVVATCAIQPSASAGACQTRAQATAARPAASMIYISGMATKFRISPASVTRPNRRAAIGARATSAQIVAA